MIYRKLFIITLFSLTGCSNSSFTSGDIPFQPPTMNSDPRKFESCENLHKWQATKVAKLKYLSGGAELGSVASGASTPSQTNNQESNVDQADVAKLDDRNIYFARSKSVEIISRKNLNPIQTIEFVDRSNLRLLLFGGQLVVIGEEKLSANFIASVYSTTGGLRRVDEFRLPGRDVRARLIGSTVVMTSQSYIDFEKPVDEVLGIPCTQIQEPVFDDLSSTVTTLHRLELGPKPRTESRAVIGSADQIYVTAKHIYLANFSYRWFSNDSRMGFVGFTNDTIVMSFDNDTLQFNGVTGISGTTNNQFSFHESDDHLFVATTIGFGTSAAANRLWTLGFKDSKFQVLASTPSFAPREDIRAARFIGSRAYIVTFEKTDPLYTFDLSDPVHPVIINELKIPGFSAYLHPLSSELLFGAGYGAVADNGFSWFQGVQLSLFKMFDDGRVDVVQQKEFGGRGGHVDVGSDHHAFQFDSENGRVYLPVRIMAKSDGAPWEYSHSLEFSGVYVIDSRLGVDPIGRLSHRDLIPKECVSMHEYPAFWSFAFPSMDIRRTLVLPQGIVTLSNFGARLYDAKAPFELLKTVEFSDEISLGFSNGSTRCSYLDQGLSAAI